MEEELISKKEVLERTGISYGQFYRWKRKGIIPEAWFIRRSTFTGQETFLPKEKILERIEKIKELKDRYSLDELAELFSPELTEASFSLEELERMDWLSQEVRDYYATVRRAKGPYSFKELLYLAVLERLRREGLTQEELELAISTLSAHALELKEGEKRKLAIARKEAKAKPAVSLCLIFDECLFDPKTEVVAQVELNKVLEELKLKLRGVR
jgi:DNA-binding transcriptional MerR regulator